MIIKYKFFETTEKFEAFQGENKIKIFNMSPICNGMQMDVISGNVETKIQARYGVFVTYVNEDE